MITASLALLMGLATVSAPAVQSLKCALPVWDVTVADINGDDRKDILAFCSDPAASPQVKSIAVFFSQEDGSYNPAPDFVLPLQPRNGTAFIANLDGSGPAELAVADAEGITAYGYWDGKLKDVMELPFTSLFPSFCREPAFMSESSLDLDGDGKDEWLAPMPGGFAVRNMNGLLANVPCDVTSTIRTGSSMSISNRYPAFAAFKFDGQAGKALMFLSDENADFAYGDNWSQTRRFEVPVNLDDKWDTSAKMYDINQDGLPDLVITQTEGTINLKALTQIYIAKGPMEYPSSPTVTFESKGTFAAPLLKDVDGDKNLDLVFLNIPFGVKFFVNLFVWKNLGVQVAVHVFKEGTFQVKPDFVTDLSIEAPDGKEQAAYCLGDFTGDGRLDAAFGIGRTELVIHEGMPDRFISGRPVQTHTVPAFGIARVYDLNGNKAEDIVIFHPGITGKDQIEVLLF
ncbi:MAG: hypothetical protein AMXMBFR84_51020 [Candidatus Hydrogenedentota bacterium]